jgi:hypothetical protein
MLGLGVHDEASYHTCPLIKIRDRNRNKQVWMPNYSLRNGTYIGPRHTDCYHPSQHQHTPQHHDTAGMKSSTIVLAFSALLVQSALASPHPFVAPRQGQSRASINQPHTDPI